MREATIQSLRVRQPKLTLKRKSRRIRAHFGLVCPFTHRHHLNPVSNKSAFPSNPATWEATNPTAGLTVAVYITILLVPRLDVQDPAMEESDRIYCHKVDTKSPLIRYLKN